MDLLSISTGNYTATRQRFASRLEGNHSNCLLFCVLGDSLNKSITELLGNSIFLCLLISKYSKLLDVTVILVVAHSVEQSYSYVCLLENVCFRSSKKEF